MVDNTKKHKRYMLIDGFNSDRVAISDSLDEVKRAATEYDAGCEGDWEPRLYEWRDGSYRLITKWTYPAPTYE